MLRATYTPKQWEEQLNALMGEYLTPWEAHNNGKRTSVIDESFREPIKFGYGSEIKYTITGSREASHWVLVIESEFSEDPNFPLMVTEEKLEDAFASLNQALGDLWPLASK